MFRNTVTYREISPRSSEQSSRRFIATAPKQSFHSVYQSVELRSNRRLGIHDETFLPLTPYPVQTKRSLSQTAAHPIRYHIHGERPLVEYRIRQNCGPQIFGYCRLSFEQRPLRGFRRDVIQEQTYWDGHGLKNSGPLLTFEWQQVRCMSPGKYLNIYRCP